MFEFGPHIDHLLTLQKKVETHTKRAATAQANVDTAFAELLNVCKPVCISVAETYNESRSLAIIPESIGLKIDLKNMTLGIAARLTFSNGREPDEDLDTNDIETIETGLKPLLEAAFKQHKIPFTFSRLCVPTAYFTK